MIRRPPEPTLFPSPTLCRPHPTTSPPTVAVDDALTTEVAREQAVLDRALARLDVLRAEALRWQAESRSEEHTSELQSRQYLVCRLLLEKKNPSAASHTRSRR